MTDRDTFAAAALTGLLATGQGPYHGVDYFAKAAYKAADAMLRERGTAVSDNCVTGNQREMECPVTEPLPKEKRAEVSVTLTDEEREAVEAAILLFPTADVYHLAPPAKTVAATLRKLLERLA